MPTSFAHLVRSEFNKGNELTLDQLYATFLKNPDLKLSTPILKHRIRSSIYSLQKSNEVTRIGDACYKKTSEIKKMEDLHKKTR